MRRGQWSKIAALSFGAISGLALAGVLPTGKSQASTESDAASFALHEQVTLQIMAVMGQEQSLKSAALSTQMTAYQRDQRKDQCQRFRSV